MAKTRSNEKVNKKNKVKYQSNTLVENTNIQAQSTTDNTSLHTDNNTLSDNMQQSLLSETYNLFNNLRGSGPASSSLKGPMYIGNMEKFTMFKHKLDNYLMINGLYGTITDENCDPSKNLALYLYISSCLDGEPFNLISANAKHDGRKAYKILCEKYTGNIHARKQKAYTELATLKQNPNETISSYISRIDLIAEKISAFGLFNDTSYYVTCAMAGLLPKYEIFRAVIDSQEDYPDWDQFKVRIQNHAQLHHNNETTQIMTVTNQSSTTITKKKQNNNYKKFLNNNGHSENEIYCTYCDTKTHWSNVCRYKEWILAAGGLKGLSINTNSGRGNTTRGRGTRRNGAGGSGNFKSRGYSGAGRAANRGSFARGSRGLGRGRASGLAARGGAVSQRGKNANTTQNSFYDYNPQYNQKWNANMVSQFPQWEQDLQ